MPTVVQALNQTRSLLTKIAGRIFKVNDVENSTLTDSYCLLNAFLIQIFDFFFLKTKKETNVMQSPYVNPQ